MERLESRELLSAVTIQLGAEKDTTIYQADPDASNGFGEYVLAGDGTRGLVQFEIDGNTLPIGSTIIDAVLTLHSSGADSGGSAVTAHPVTKAWGESISNASGDESTGAAARPFDATWLYASYDGQLWGSAGGDFAGVSASAQIDGPGAYELIGGNLIDDIQGWIDNPESNFGWLLQAGSATINRFISRNAPDSSLGPVLEITYEEPPSPPITIEGRIWNDVNGDGSQSNPTLAALNLQILNGNTYYDAFGGQEYWFRSESDNRWYFLTSDGNLTQWSGVGGSLTGTTVTNLDPKFYQNPSLVTQDNSGDPEPWLNDWTVELLDETGTVLNTVTTTGRDLNQDGTIDPDSEGGWYSFEVSASEDYTVRTVMQGGWAETSQLTFSSVDPNESSVNAPELEFRTSFYEDFGGLSERWMYSQDHGWYYIVPNGDLYRWDGNGVSEDAPLNGTLVASPGTAYYDDPLLLSDGFTEPSDPNPAVPRVDFGVAKSQTVKGRVWLDFYDNGTRDYIDLIPEFYVLYPIDTIGADEEWFFDHENSDWYVIDADGRATYFGPHEDTDGGGYDRPGNDPQPPQFREFAEDEIEPWLNGKTVKLVDAQGTVVATTESRSIDLNGDGTIQYETERGWYVFENVPSGDYTISVTPEDGWQQTAPTTAEQTVATALDNAQDFRTTTSDFLNWGGLNERWLINEVNQWHYVTPDGALYLWNSGTNASNGGLKGTLVAQFTSAYYGDLTLISEPETGIAAISVAPDVDLIDVLFGSHQNLAGG